MNLIHLFDLSLHGKANRPALEWGSTNGLVVSTFAELEARSNRLARLLESRGLHKDDRLCVYLKNRSEFIDLYLACLKLGVVFVPINILYRERELIHILLDVEPKAIVASEDLRVPALLWKMEDLRALASAMSSAR